VPDVMVLCYHAVSPTWDATFSITPTSLRRQIRSLVRQGWHPTTFETAVGAPPAPKTLAITFDDAFASVKRYAVPILQELGAVATVFAPTGFMAGGETLQWPGIEEWVQTEHRSELTAMAWSDLRQLLDLGWEIGSHTRTHPRLTRCSDEQLREELAGAQTDLRRELGIDAAAIAYPYGDVDQRVVAAATEAGYRAGAALGSRLDKLGPLRFPRIGIYHVDAGWRFRLKVTRGMRELRSSRLWPR
jgi:peptidoglycan/xylan/chitin deacetylase (PgdA/CDA1 family)